MVGLGQGESKSFLVETLASRDFTLTSRNKLLDLSTFIPPQGKQEAFPSGID